jgi:hypothetical protein
MLFTNARKKRNMCGFDIGLHTLHMKMKPGEWDHEFVQRFLIEYINGCKQRGGEKYKDFVLHHRKKDDNYITVWGIK